MDTVIIRQAHFVDAPLLASVKLAESGGDLEKTNIYFSNILSPECKETWKYFIALNGDIPVGSAAIRLYDQKLDENMYGTREFLPNGWYLRAVRVHPDYRQQGIARKLTEARLGWLKENTNSCFVFIDDENKVTLPMYRDLGFVEISRGWTYSDPHQIARNIRGVLMERVF